MPAKTGNAQIFVKIDDYKGVLNMLDDIKSKLTEAKENIERIKSIRQEEDKEFEEWNNSLSEIEKRMENIDRELLEPEGI